MIESLISISDGDGKLQKKIKANMAYLGFDFSLIGSHLIKEMLLQIIQSPTYIHAFSSSVMKEMANRYNYAVKSIDRDIRWSISKAYTKGILKDIPYFTGGRAPTIKQLVNWFFDFFIDMDYACIY